MTRQHTVESLTQAIRDATSLAELKRMVGPSDEENERARQRVEHIEQMHKDYGPPSHTWPSYALYRHEQLQKQQDEFEAMYA